MGKGRTLAHAMKSKITPFGRWFDAMIDGISKHMNKRIVHQVNHVAINFNILAFHYKVHEFVAFTSNITHHPRHFLESWF